MASTVSPSPQQPAIWWNNIIFFVGAHFAAAYGVYRRPPTTVPAGILAATVVLWQLASFGVTIGYHRMYSHRAFNASLGVRIVLALVGASAFQGSIKWWCLRHRLHHRFTDDEENDPYCATRGFLFSHVGWIFFKPNYAKLHLIERDDLEEDPVVRLQHKYFVPAAVATGIVLPTLFGAMYSDKMGGFIYAGLVARILIWHCTFLVNSLAHWDGLQPYTDENTSRTNFLLALLTAGEGNHNFHHAFPHDFRSGPAKSDFDPSKWVIILLEKLGIAYGLRRANPTDVAAAREYMIAQEKLGLGHHHHHHAVPEKPVEADEWTGPTWSEAELRKYVKESSKCVVVVDGYAVDVTSYAKVHPGGAALLQDYSVPADPAASGTKWKDADWAYNGGVNKHSQAARRRVKQLRVAKVA
ncbi:fatty acid desaturase-domain-containing protein [Gloeopeniophorella convolvens]|nr:fatty acid desaturase-domain-containing protein [Gloeopeniophorella convolvens]